MRVISFLASVLIEIFVRPVFSLFEMETLICWALGVSVLILTVLILRFLLRERISCRIRYALWLAVAARWEWGPSCSEATPASPAAWKNAESF